MCDAHLDALSCLQSAISRGFPTDQLRLLAQLCIEHGLSEDEADTFLSDIPVLGEQRTKTCITLIVIQVTYSLPVLVLT